MYYIRIENDNFGFVVDDIHTILDTDIKISDEDYSRFFDLQYQGKQFRIKNPNRTTLFEIVEEYTPILEDTTQEITLEDRIESLEQENADLLLDSAIKDTKIETLENDVADILFEMVGGM